MQREQSVPTRACHRLGSIQIEKMASPTCLLADLGASIPANKDVRRMVNRESIMLPGLVLMENSRSNGVQSARELRSRSIYLTM